MLHDLAQATGLANYIIGVISGLLLVAAVLMRSYGTVGPGSDERQFLIGVKAIGFGFMFHQVYWLLWRVFFNLETYTWTKWLAENAWVVTPFYAMMIFGGLKCVSVVSGFHDKIPTWQIAGAIMIWLSGLAVGIYIQ